MFQVGKGAIVKGGEITHFNGNFRDSRSAKTVLEDIAAVVIRDSVYQRVLISLYECPITDSPGSKSRVLTYASRGIDPQCEEKLRVFVAEGGLISGEKFRPDFRLGNAYYIPEGSVPHSITPLIPSRRRFLNPLGWHAGDLLLVPLRIEGKIIGQISVDDPRDGARPTEQRVRGLEDLASVTAIALQEAHLMERWSEDHELFHLLAENALTGLAVTNEERFCYVNDRAVELLCYPREELLRMQPWWQVIHPEERGAIRKKVDSFYPRDFEARGIRKDGSSIWLKVHCRPIKYENHAAVLLNLLDVSDKVRTEALLKEKALRDPLTGLFNRHYFDENIQIELKRSQRYKRPFTLLMTDLTGFKRVNDRLGHQEGDRVLRDIARVIQEQLRESDWMIRYGGDEFLIVLPETRLQIEVLARRLRTAVDQWSTTHLAELPLSLDIGWATWTQESNLSIHRLVELADANMYAEKTERQNVGR